MIMTNEVDELRPDVVTRCHGEPAMIQVGIECDAVNAIRFLAADAVERAGSGHPGTPMALAPLGYRLYTRYLRHDPEAPGWPDRDRFVLSAGHASLLQYACLHLSGYDLSIEDLASFRQLGSKTPGHPERGHTPGIEVTTGPLGQGISMAVGLAAAERMLAARFNRDGHPVVDHRTWVIAGDGDLMEGVSGEAASLAGHLGLGRLIVFYDDNHISIEGSTDLAFCEHVARRFEAYGWQVLRVDDVNDFAALDAAAATAVADEDRPTIVVTRSHIGYGSTKQGSAEAHGAPLGADAVAAARQRLGWPHAPFEVPDAVIRHWRESVDARVGHHRQWRERSDRYREAHPDLAAELQRRLEGRLPAGVRDVLPFVAPEGSVATRKALGKVLNALAPVVPELVGGSADLAPSTNTTLEGEGDVARGEWSGRNFHFGVREHAMGAILNGMAAHGGLRVFGATFLVFSDYLRPALRLSALMQLPVIYVFTHDSVALGEDGPTHQPIEHLASMRAIPGLTVIRPADANETALAVADALKSPGPVALVLSRQGLPVLDPEGRDIAGSVVADGADATIVASGSEVGLALAARPISERDALVPPDRPTVAVEAGSTQGWCTLADATVGIDRFGISAPGPEAMAHLGVTPGDVAERVVELLGRGG